MKTDFKVRVEVDPSTKKVLAVYLRIRRGRVANVREMVSGTVFANYGATGQLLGIEILGPCQVAILEKIVRKEPEEVRTLVREKLPPEMKGCA